MPADGGRRVRAFLSHSGGRLPDPAGRPERRVRRSQGTEGLASGERKAAVICSQRFQKKVKKILKIQPAGNRRPDGLRSDPGPLAFQAPPRIRSEEGAHLSTSNSSFGTSLRSPPEAG